MIAPKSNLLSMVLPFLLFMIPIAFCIYGMFYGDVKILYLLIFCIAWGYLIYEATVNDYATYFIKNNEIILTKPWRKFSLFRRKRNHQIVIRPDEWDSLYYNKLNNRQGSLVILYFRKDRSLVYFFSASSLQKSVDRIKEAFPEKHYVNHLDIWPKKLIKEMRKTHRERVL
jgi:hypothetical protein